MYYSHVKLFLKCNISGKAARKKEEKQKGTQVQILNEDFFFANPEIFIYRAFPKDNRWQLITRKWDFTKFAEVPYFERYFFTEDLEIHSKFSGRLVAKLGECNVEIGSKISAGLNLDYQLYYDHVESGKEMSTCLQLSNYVLLNRANSLWNFGIRFPEAGVYKLQIDGGRNYVTKLCEFRIDCRHAQDDCKPLPFNPGKIGYGPSIDTANAGVKALSHTQGVVKMTVRKQTDFKFNLTKQVNVKTQLIHSTMKTAELEKYCVQVQNNRALNVRVTMPEGGEYALAMYTQNGKLTENVCNYLLTSDDRNKKGQRDWEVKYFTCFIGYLRLRIHPTYSFR